MSAPQVEVLIPTFRRPAALAVVLSGLAAQRYRDLAIVIADQSPPPAATQTDEVRAMIRILEASGVPVRVFEERPRRGLAEQRQFLLDQASAPYVLFLDDDIWLKPTVLGDLVGAIRNARCGFVGCAPIGLSFRDDVRPHEEEVELWSDDVSPETVSPATPEWDRHRLHNAANLLHVQERLAAPGPRLYKVAWIGGCVLFDREILVRAGGFQFWSELPERHAGEDVLAQLRVMRLAGGAGLLPSGAFHLELPTTVPDREVDAPHAIPI